MDRKITSALISVFYKAGLEPIVRRLHELDVQIYSTGGTQSFIEQLNIPCKAVEDVTSYPSILGGRVKTLHPKIFGGILARRDFEEDQQHVEEYEIPLLDLVIVDLYPFEETVKNLTPPKGVLRTTLSTSGEGVKAENKIIEKIDIGGVSLIRAAAKNFKDVLIVSSRDQYEQLSLLLEEKNAITDLDDRRRFAAAAFAECAHYDVAISDYFNQGSSDNFQLSVSQKQSLRYGENPHQKANFYGDINELFEKLNGKELSYNNLVDADAACQIIANLTPTKMSKADNISLPQLGERLGKGAMFAIIKHTNVCGIAMSDNVMDAWINALAGDPESAFGGVLITNEKITLEVSEKINELFFEILIAPEFDEDALHLLKTKKNRIILKQKKSFYPEKEFKRIFNGVLVQDADTKNYETWTEVGGHESTEQEKQDLEFANIVCKHLKSNAIALVKDKKLIGKGCGQTSRIDALKQAIEKAKYFGFSLEDAALASDAFFPFDDCVRVAHGEGITAIIQPGGSVRDNDTIQFCKDNDMALVMTGTRHFKH